MGEVEEEHAYQRYMEIREILEVVKPVKRAQYLNLIENLVKTCARYVQVVNAMETVMKIQRFRLEPEEFQARVQEHDQRRKLAHDAVISLLTAVNRNLFSDQELKGEIPIGGIYSMDPNTMHHRAAIGHWAGFLVKGLARHGLIRLQ